MNYTMGSLFDGSGGFPLAGSLCGITPKWASEVEPYPIAVTRSRFPDMKHLGDISKINGAEIEPVDIITFGSPCFPAGTLVLTDKGYEPIESIRAGDKVLTHKGNWKPVSSVGYKYSRTVKMKGHHYGVIATPNHPFYSAEQGKSWNGNGYTRTLENVGEWTPAEEMQDKLWAVPNCISGLRMPSIERTSERQNKLPEINEDLMYIIGRYLGDGWVRNGQRPHRTEGQTWGQIFICANKNKADYLEERMHRVFDGTAAVCRFSDRTIEKFRVSHQPLCRWILDNFGCMAEGKTIPAWAYCMSDSMRASLLQGYLDSDGYRSKVNEWRAVTVSKRLAHGVRLLGETLGYSTTVYFVQTEEKKTIEGRVVNQKPYYQICLNNGNRKMGIKADTHTWYKCRSVEPYSDEQKVYNITVDEDHSYVVEGFVVHNCQDLSVAGKRAGLKHEANGYEETTRSGLFMEAVRIIKEMRGATNGKYPRFALWENVPGAFSSNKGEDFRVVCEELIKIVEPSAVMPAVPKKGWPYADSYIGDGWSLAYRVFDAQYWGVPQRRRRIHLVADFRGECAREILFEREGVRWHFETGRTPWKAVTGDAERSSGADDCEGVGINGEVAATLDASYYKGCGMRQGIEREVVVQPITDTHILDDQGGQQIAVRSDGKCPTLRAETHGNVPCIMECAQIFAVENHPSDSRVNINESGTVQTLTSRMGTGGGNVPMVMEPIVYDGAGITSPVNASNPQPGDPCHTLSTDSRNYACVPTAQVRPVYCPQCNGIDRADTAGCNGRGWKEDTCYTLTRVDRPAVAYGIENGQANQSFSEELAGALNCMHDQQAVGYAMQAIGAYADKDIASSLKQRDYKDATDLVVERIPPQYIVRRLTPTECARLQGFADRWGHPDRKDSFTPEEYTFWLEVRNTHAAINGKQVKDYTEAQMLTWYNKLHTDSAE